MTEHELFAAYSANPPPAEPAILTHVATSYCGQCVACGWEGRARRDSLAALRDFDRHAATQAHALLATAAPDDEPDDDAMSVEPGGRNEPTCDYCGQSCYVAPDDWNGETGNHRSCEDVPTV